jgi:hypothetical protein
MGKAQIAFNGAHQKRGEYQDSPALQRVFNSFEDIEATLPHLAECLYQPMLQAAKVIHLSAPLAEKANA